MVARKKRKTTEPWRCHSCNRSNDERKQAGGWRLTNAKDDIRTARGNSKGLQFSRRNWMTCKPSTLALREIRSGSPPIRLAHSHSICIVQPPPKRLVRDLPIDRPSRPAHWQKSRYIFFIVETVSLRLVVEQICSTPLAFAMQTHVMKSSPEMLFRPVIIWASAVEPEAVCAYLTCCANGESNKKGEILKHEICFFFSSEIHRISTTCAGFAS